MVISHKHKYLFIEIPITGSWAIRHELCEHYDGSLILHKHASYPEFQRIATEDEKQYFVFATVRNPLDGFVSGFFKLKTDHKGVFSDSQASIQSSKIDYSDVTTYQEVQKADVSIESFFLRSRIWDRPYSGMIDVSASSIDFVIRFESLDQGFAEVLRLLGVKQLRQIPVSNKTKGRKAAWESYFTPQMYAKAKRIYGPFMRKWKYDFPQGWGDYEVSKTREAEYGLSVAMKKFYLTRIRYSDATYAKFGRKLNARMKRLVYR